MMTTTLKTSFDRIGARLAVTPWHGTHTVVRSRYRGVVVDVLEDGDGSYYTVGFDPSFVWLDVLDVRPARRHLLLAARNLDGSSSHGVLCGHDVQRWYVAAVGPCTATTTIDEVLERSQRLTRTRRPGAVAYADRHQVAADDQPSGLGDRQQSLEHHPRFDPQGCSGLETVRCGVRIVGVLVHDMLDARLLENVERRCHGCIVTVFENGPWPCRSSTLSYIRT